jgi:hypothetical protein
VLPVIVIVVSFFSGGLAGACVSVFFNRLFHRRELRTKFYPVLNDMFSAYAIRMEKPEGRYWTTIVGLMPALADKDFVEHRSDFISDLVQYNELKEVRVLRKQFLDNSMRGDHVQGKPTTLDLAPESAALHLCFNTIHKKLKL